MSIFSVLHTKKLTPSWEYRTQGILWRLLPGPDFFVGEDRDNDKRSVSFFCVEEQTGTVRWKDVRFDEPWWISIEAVHQHVVILHQFARPDMPEHKQVIALDGASRQLLWTNEDYKFLFAHEDSIYAAKDMFEGRLFVELDLHTGKLQREFKDQAGYINVLRETASSKIANDVEFPRVLSLQAEQLTRSKKISRLLTSHVVHGDVEIVERDPWMIIGYYTIAHSTEQELEQHLQVIDTEDDSVVFEDLLVRKAKAPVPDTFFVRNNLLFYIKHENTLTAVRLP